MIIPLGILSTLISTSIKEGGLNKVKVFLTFCSGSIAYASVFILLKYMDSNDNKLFQCTLSIFVPNSGPFNFANLTFQRPEDVAKLFGNASMWRTIGINNKVNFVMKHLCENFWYTYYITFCITSGYHSINIVN